MRHLCLFLVVNSTIIARQHEGSLTREQSIDAPLDDGLHGRPQ
jgi:hypothetical protein